ncbi:HD-GYP domain-containing protein [Anaerobranca gottschalkii]|uniref:HD-GYP domain, c-di-GMP phosphodiesterase class II (Or its inactivated variant) n=1 Tax=Anaerobranca gottschalkii DSM 13577 TaxID=1120990 RepID=A0A1I0ANQ4_9FIRM|nr:HD-GYP domain-containing protein [Anaerobranca gottschalkii]SES95388.1 HD-GYP domain, c-di-GMP phosphodiesterase class II (or its inactivated variant) [Anaerobranca gottschalkii DSM 13577]
MWVKISDLTPGTKVGKDILTKHGSILLTQGTVLTEYLINRLKEMGITEVFVETEFLQKSEPPNEREDVITFNDKYQQCLILTSQLLDSIEEGKKFSLELLREIACIVLEILRNTTNLWGRILNQRTETTYLNKHSLNVGILSGAMGKWLELKDGEIRRLIYSGILHDIGKLKISKSILDKPSKLTEEEFKEIQKHPVFGFQMLATRPEISKDITLGVLSHHERVDGSGYPHGLKGDSIHLFGKIIAVADVFDAMSSNKTYREKHSPFIIAEEISKSSFGTLDPKVSRIFLDNITRFYVGNKVLLSDGRTGDIIYINPSDTHRPVIKINDNTFLDLRKEKVRIVDIVSL